MTIGYGDCIALLTQDQTHRVWSVIVTVFGDLAQKPGDQISAQALTKITKAVGFKPEAVRVALHRLRKDGWITSTRDGRASLYELSAHGRAQSAAVSPRIYGPAPKAPAQWHVLVAGPDDTGALDHLVADAGYVQLGTRSVLGQGPLPGDISGMLGIAGADLTVPDWLRTQLCPPDSIAACDQLHARLTVLSGQLRDMAGFTPVQIAALRTLIVHSWRRVLLRHTDLPDDLFPADWKGAECRALVADLLHRLPRPPLKRLGG